MAPDIAKWREAMAEAYQKEQGIVAPDDAVSSPRHYKAAGFEVIDIIEAFGLGFRLANVVKYVLRAGRKGPPEQRLEDLKKARFYLDREIVKTGGAP